MIKRTIPEEDKYYSGAEFDGRRVWREKTPEEKLQDRGVNVEAAKIFVRWQENKTDQS